MIKNIIISTILAIFISSCSTNTEETSKTELDILNEKYSYLPIKLKEFAVENKTSPLPNGKEISIEEKAHVLKAIDIMRFVINTPEFRTEVFSDIYEFEAAKSGTGTKRSINKGEYYNKNIVFNILKNAAITTYILKTDIGGDANALGTLGSRFYLNVDANNPVVEGDNNNATYNPLALLIMLPNTFYWADKDALYSDEYVLAGIIFHELIHNLGFKHLNGSPNPIDKQHDTADKMEDIFMDIVNKTEWRNKYKTELAEYNYYQKKYKHFLENNTTPK